MKTETPTTDFQKRQRETLFLLFIGYVGYYFCRTFFASAKPLLIEQYGHLGINKETLGLISTVGTLTYAAGKFTNTVVCDFVGGRRMLLLGMLGSIVFTLLFSASAGVTWFLAWWALNRLVQSAGWGGLVKIASNWFSYAHYGSVMAILSLTFVLGDVSSKVFYGWLLNRGASWQMLGVAGPGVLGAIALWNFWRLRNSPREIGYASPPQNPQNVFARSGQDDKNRSVIELLKPFFRSGSFWAVLVLSFGLTIVRDTFGEWLPLYLTEVAGLTPGQASMWSSVFPLFGAVSILAVGWTSDRLLGGRRGGIMAVLLSVAVTALYLLGRISGNSTAAVAVALSAAVALLTIGPYSFLAGAIALDLGGRRGSATASGMVDGVGYIGGIVSGYGIGSIAQRLGWGAAFYLLTCIAAGAAVAALIYGQWCERRPRPEKGSPC